MAALFLNNPDTVVEPGNSRLSQILKLSVNRWSAAGEVT